MTATSELVERARAGDVVTMSLSAGFEIEKSRLKRSFEVGVIHKFGNLLRKRSLLTNVGGGKGLANPELAAPMNHLYRRSHGAKSASLEVIYGFLDEVAGRFENFSDDLSEKEKTALVELSAQLHELLSEETGSIEGDVEYGWRH
jgi:hypothetical protein